MKRTKKKVFIRSLGVLFLLFAVVISDVFNFSTANAGQIYDRSLTLIAGPTDGGSKAGSVAHHLFNFTMPSSGIVGSLKFLYCTSSAGACIMPAGLVTTSATLNSQSGATGFNGAPYITRTAASISGPLTASYRLNTITNPTNVNESFYVRITSHVATNGSGASTDSETVGASTATQILLSGTMPESMTFCTGGTITTVVGVPDCSTATSGSISFNQFFSPEDTATASSQMAASTNANTGYVITVNGPTMSSGSNEITGMSTAAPIARGTSQFGMNLRANTTATSTVAIGSNITAVSDGIKLKAQSLPGYNVADSFKFISGDTIANSAIGGAGPTNTQLYTASYIVNVQGSQAAGTYTSTLTYICTALF
jgi:hypothetical protein